ncbi:hypothetical protein IE53DRAFT_399002 [Violaceomyces palustris]|uniref:Uncharacterized protein n=1 Tax=Violaceomyces palustris TaxID=1673888 RepID=A0ACD0P5P7_9BASI|nr:hypothetical protein IE53DRAFT_399002 [Violaceomyces palustris]
MGNKVAPKGSASGGKRKPLPFERDSLGYISERSVLALENLYNHVPEPGSEPCPSKVPAYRRAAVLLGLFVGRNGELYVILSKRSSHLRSHGGDTAIPGGRFEPTDRDLEFTARREAYEETGLPIDYQRTIKLCELQPFLSANELVVTPFVVLLTDKQVQPHLNPREVDSLFSLPFSSFLHHHPPQEMRSSLRLTSDPSLEKLKAQMSEVMHPSDWHSCRDILWLGGSRIRRHTFYDERNPIRGLTSDILIHASSLAYGQAPTFVLEAPGQPSQARLIELAFNSPLRIQRFRVKPRMSFLLQHATGQASSSVMGDNLQQPVDEDSNFRLAPPPHPASTGLDQSQEVEGEDRQSKTSKSKL